MSRVGAASVCLIAMSGVFVGAAYAQTGDRYGPSAPAYGAAPTSISAPSPVTQSSFRMLSWPGKTASAEAMVSARAEPASAPPSMRQTRAPLPAPQSRPAVQQASAAIAPDSRRGRYVESPKRAESLAPPSALNPHYGLVQAAPPVRSMPQLAGPPTTVQSIYDPAPAMASRAANPTPSPAAPRQTEAVAEPPADPAHPDWAPPRRAWSQAGDTGVRFYSLHRQYGVKPDPAPIPPQFFTATADVTEPAGPIPRTVSGAGAKVQAARALQASDADAPSGQP